MSSLIDIPAALVASPRPCAPVAAARRFADDAQPRLRGRLETSTPMAWRHLNGSTMRGFETAAQHTTQDGRTAYVTTKQHAFKQHLSIRSGPPTSRPPA